MTESETRALIDKQLRQVSWEADTNNLRYSKGTRPVNGRNIAIAENSKIGDADLLTTRFLSVQSWSA